MMESATVGSEVHSIVHSIVRYATYLLGEAGVGHALELLLERRRGEGGARGHLGSTYGCSLRHLRSQPLVHTVAASASYGCSLRYLKLQPRVDTVAASATYGCSIYRLQLQPVLQMRPTSSGSEVGSEVSGAETIENCHG